MILGLNFDTFMQCLLSSILFREVYIRWEPSGLTIRERIIRFIVQVLFFVSLEVILYYCFVYFKIVLPKWARSFMFLPYILHIVGLSGELFGFFIHQDFLSIAIPLVSPFCSCFFMFTPSSGTSIEAYNTLSVSTGVHMFLVLTFFMLLLVPVVHAVTHLLEVNPTTHRWRLLLQRTLYFFALYYSNRLQSIL